MKLNEPIWLASRSPRRMSLLEAAGVHPRVEPTELDESSLRPGSVLPELWVMALAYLKGRSVADRLRGESPRSRGTVLAADTLCVHRDRLLGQPRSEAEARRMLRLLQDDVHRTVTGVCLIDLASGRRRLFFDRATVHIGAVHDEQMESYVGSGAWRGKAGGYNLQDRLADDWPIECQGDPTTVMGLPMQRLEPLLRQAGSGC